jgi:sarcosine oxidase delta subunit
MTDEVELVTCPFCGEEMTRDEYDGGHACDPAKAEAHTSEILKRKGLMWP